MSKAPSAQAPLLLIGCGHMGRALLGGWSATVGAEALAVIDRNRHKLHDAHVRLSVSGFLSVREWPRSVSPSLLVLATKPSGLADILTAIASHFDPLPPIVSVAAGKTLDFYAQHLGADAAVVRAMPNLPVTVRAGMSVCIANEQVSDAQRAAIARLFEMLGRVSWLDREDQMHVATALSGSGPAYCFHLLDCLVDAATALGLSAPQARLLAVQTLKGAALLADESDASFSQLRNNVTSPGGTTEAGLKEWMGTEHPGLAALTAATLKAAAARSAELAEKY